MTRTLIMAHGIGAGGDTWDRMRPAFETSGWTCHTPTLFPDKRTVDAPPADLPQLAFDDYIDTYVALANEIETSTGHKPAMIGHSMGGLIAQALAERGHLAAAVFLTPAQPKDCSVTALSVLWTFGNILAKGTKRGRSLPHKIWRRGFHYGILNRVAKDRHDAIYANARFDSGRVYGDLLDGIEIDEQKINVPTLTIGAAHDRATVVKAVRKVGNKYAASPVPGDYLEYANHGHWIVDEPGTDQVFADIKSWLDRHMPA